MKIYNKILALAILAIGLTSCLKDKAVEDQKYGMINLNANKVIEIPSPSTRSIAVGLEYKDELVTFDLTKVHLAAENPAAEDISVSLSVANSQSVITKWNTDNGTNLVLLPSNFYTLPDGLNLTIPKGEKNVALPIKMNAINLDPSTTYAIVVSIASVSNTGYVVSGNFNYVVVTISAKNKYDGVYRLTGLLSGVTDRPTLGIGTQFTWPGDGKINLVTISGNQVALYDGYYNWGGGIAQWVCPINTPTSYSAFGSVRPLFTFNNSNNTITSVTNAFVNPSNGRALQIDPTYTNKFDPATKTIDVRFIMTQPNFQPLTITYKFTYKSARP